MSENEKKDRMLELLADQAVFGLTVEEKAEFEALSKEFPGLADDFSLEETAAAIAFAGIGEREEMPEHLRSAILKDAANHLQPKAELSDKIDNLVETATLRVPERVVFEEPKRPYWHWLGWAVAGAACLVLAVNVWFTRLGPVEVAGDPQAAQSPTPEPSMTQKRDRLLASAKEIFKAPVSSPAEDKSLSGEIVWSDAEQAGFMTFKGLPVNDKSKETYQLWIFDETQDEKTPVDGGVFDINENGEVIIPIDAKLNVKNPKMFAVTVEKPGGVVVSKREKIVALGKVQT
ncbi:MAG: anti-sigma factor [Pyrinomonadaceae bacterium]